MKRLIILLIVVLTTINSYAQETEIVTYKNMLGRKNFYTDNFFFESPVYSTIVFYLTSSYIRANDKSRSLYRMVSERFDLDKPDFKSYSWKCLDENNNDCTFTLMTMKDSNVRIINIMYENVSYVYYIK